MIFIIAAGDAEGSVVLTDGEVNTLAPDKEVNAIVEEVNAIVEGVHAVQDADGVAAWDAEDNGWGGQFPRCRREAHYYRRSRRRFRCGAGLQRQHHLGWGR